MSRAYTIAGVGLAAIVGILTVYNTFLPELVKQQAEVDPAFKPQHQETAVSNNAISQAMISDFKEAGEVVRRSGFGWGIRDAILGKKTAKTTIAPPSQQPTSAAQAPATKGDR